MATIRALEATGRPDVGGFVITFPSGVAKSAHWVSEAPIQDPLEAAKTYSATVLQCLLDERRIDDADRTNWPSVTACVQKLILDFNEARRKGLYAQPH